MAKPKGATNTGSNPGLDYYEYKRMHEMERLRERAVALDGDVAHKDQHPAAQPTQIFGKLGGGKRRQDAVELQAMPAPVQAMPEPPVQVEAAPVEPESSQAGKALVPEEFAAPKPHSRRAKKAGSEDRSAVPTADQSEPTFFDETDSGGAETEQLEAESPEGGAFADALPALADEPEEDELEITNPFAGTFDKIKLIGSKLFAKRAPAQPDFEDDVGVAKGMDKESIALGEEDTEEEETKVIPFAPSRRHQRYQPREKHIRAESDIEGLDADDADTGAEDPLGVIAPLDAEFQRAYMRPAQRQQAGESGPRPYQATTQPAKEDTTMNDNAQRAELTEKLMDELNSVPALSRRERKAMAAAGTLRVASKQVEKIGSDEPVGETTQQFKPLRARQVEPSKPAQPDAQDDDEDEDAQPRRKFGIGRGKARARDDDDDAYDDDEYSDGDKDEDYDERPRRKFGIGRGKERARDDYDDDEYDEDSYDEYDDEYDDDYDEYDEIEEYERQHKKSGGKQLLGLLKTLLVLVIVLLIIVAGLRQLEASGLISLDIARSTVGQILPIERLFPAPAATVDADLPDVTDQVDDLGPGQEGDVGDELDGLGDELSDPGDAPDDSIGTSADMASEVNDPEVDLNSALPQSRLDLGAEGGPIESTEAPSAMGDEEVL